MPQDFGPYDQRRKQQEAIIRAIQDGRASPTEGGMADPYVTAESQERASQDFTGQERAIQSQRAYATQLGGKAAPKGKTVGPSGLYVGPNWGESLEYGINQGLSGYMRGQANKKGEALDKGRADQRKAETEVEEGQLRRKEDIRLGERSEDMRVAAKRHKDSQAQEVTTITNGEEEISGYPTPEGWVTGDGKMKSFEEYKEVDSKASGYRSSLLKNKQTIFKDGQTRQIADQGDFIVGMDENGQYQPLGFNPEEEGWQMGAMDSKELDKHIAAFEKTENTGKLRELAVSTSQMLETLDKFELSVDDMSELLGQTGKAGGLSGKVSRILGDLSEKGIPEQEVYSSVAQVLNDIIRSQAGMSQTVAEIQRVTEAYGNDLVSHPDVMEWALKRMMGRVDHRLQGAKSQLGQQGVDRYSKQHGGKSFLDIDFSGEYTSDEETEAEAKKFYEKAPKSGKKNPGLTGTVSAYEGRNRKRGRKPGSKRTLTAPVEEVVTEESVQAGPADYNSMTIEQLRELKAARDG